MIEALTQLLVVLNTLSPLAIIGLLGAVIFLMAHEKGPIKILANNHLDHVQASLDKIVVNGEAQTELLNQIKSELNYLKGKLDR